MSRQKFIYTSKRSLYGSNAWKFTWEKFLNGIKKTY